MTIKVHLAGLIWYSVADVFFMLKEGNVLFNDALNTF